MAPSTANARSSAIGSRNMPSDLERGAMPLGDLPRLSTETQRRNGYIQSSATDTTTRIREDLDSGNYLCSICTDNITKNGDVLQNVYHCRDCYNVFHFRCIKAWARQKLGLNPLSFQTWPCPMCKCERAEIPKVSCWCGKSNTLTECASTCAIVGDCPHGKLKKCIKDCHPGPCEYHCESSCANLPILGVDKEPTAWDNICYRFRTAPLISKKKVVNLGSLLAIIIIATQIYCFFYARWNMMPYRYIGYEKKYGSVVDILTMVGGIFLTICLALLSIQVMDAIHKIYCHVLDLKDLTTNRQRKLFNSQVSFMVLFFAAIFSTVSIFMGLIVGPVKLWNNQMQDSCAGFSLLVSLSGANSSNTLEITSSRYDVQPRTAYLAPHFAPVLRDTTVPFQWYQRLTGKSFNNTHIAVDVDISNRLWRLYHLNDTDAQNQWLAIGHNDTGIHFSPAVPEFFPVSETLVANGTFSDTDILNKHMHIPELNLSVSNHWHFRDSNSHKPFLRVFNTTNLTTSDANKLLNTEWSTSKDTDRMVMRTRKRYATKTPLTMCVRESDYFGYTEDPKWRFVTCVKEELFVPLAIVQALRTPGEILRWW